MSYKKAVTLHRTKNQNDNIMKYLITLLLAVLATVNVTAQDVVYPDNMEYLQLQVATENTDDPYKGNNPSFAPIRRPIIGISGNTLYLYMGSSTWLR